MDIWFFYGFLLTFLFSIRKVITFFPVRGQFNEYTGAYLYLSDIFLILTLLSWIIILCNKYSILSICNNTPINRHKLWTRLYPQFSPRHILAYLSLILVLWSFLSILWSDNQIIALFRSIKLFEFFVLAIFVTYRIVPSRAECSTPAPPKNVPRGTLDKNAPLKLFHVEHSQGGGTFLKDTFKLMIFGGIINSILAIWQFIIQHSIGLTFLKESFLSPDIAGVAKIVLFGHKLIRAYGFFQHPNILGGFLVFSIVITICYRQMFHVEHFKISPFGKGGWGGFEKLLKNHQPSNPSVLRNIPACRQAGLFFKGRASLLWLLLTIQIIALILTFSKSSIIGLILALLYINVPRGTFREVESSRLKNWRQMFHVEHLSKFMFLTISLLFVTISIFPNLSPIQNQSLDQREILSIVPRGTISDNPVLGVGQGQLIWSMRNNPELLDWQFQPVHNVFLLIWSELGIIGLILFVWLLWKMFHPRHNVPRGTLCGTDVEHFENSPLVKGDLPEVATSLQAGVRLGQRDFYENETKYTAVEIKTKIPPTPLYKGGALIFQGVLLGFIFIMLFDHYLWDIQQGQIMLWLVIGFIYGLSLTNSNASDNISL